MINFTNLNFKYNQCYSFTHIFFLNPQKCKKYTLLTLKCILNIAILKLIALERKKKNIKIISFHVTVKIIMLIKHCKLLREKIYLEALKCQTLGNIVSFYNKRTTRYNFKKKLKHSPTL